jgi:hypothetical protein
VAALRMWKSTESETRVQRKKTMGEAKSRTRARRAVKKRMSAAAHLKCRARRVSETFAQTRACPGETGAHSCDASIPADYMNL